MSISTCLWHAHLCLCMDQYVNIHHSWLQWRTLAKWVSSSSHEGACERKSMSTCTWLGFHAGKVMCGVKKNQRSTSIWVSVCSKYWSAVTQLTLLLMVNEKVRRGKHKSRLCLLKRTDPRRHTHNHTYITQTTKQTIHTGTEQHRAIQS